MNLDFNFDRKQDYILQDIYNQVEEIEKQLEEVIGDIDLFNALYIFVGKDNTDLQLHISKKVERLISKKNDLEKMHMKCIEYKLLIDEI